jgi:FkbM family methyltransferase
MTAFSDALRKVGRAVPAWLPRGTAVGNRLLKPAYKLLGGQARAENVEVWPGVRMNLLPGECIGGNLFFSPHLYDCEERSWITEHLPQGGTFIDVGANIGAYTLWAAACLGQSGRVVAIEADPTNYSELLGNIALNPDAVVVDALNIGVAETAGELPFYHSPSRNAGGHSFVHHPGHEFVGTIPVRPLHEVLVERHAPPADLMKIDIEGYEREVLRSFFTDCMSAADLRPTHLVMELGEGPLAADTSYNSDLLEIVDSAGYRPVAGKRNVLFRLVEARHV